MPAWDRATQNRIIERVREREKLFRQAIRRQNVGVPIGHETVDDETWAAWFEQKVLEHPPAELVEEESGETFIASPFIAALAYADGGEAVLRRYERIRGIRE